MWDLPSPGLQPVSPALAGGFLTTAPPGKPWKSFFKGRSYLYPVLWSISLSPKTRVSVPTAMFIISWLSSSCIFSGGLRICCQHLEKKQFFKKSKHCLRHCVGTLADLSPQDDAMWPKEILTEMALRLNRDSLFPFSKRTSATFWTENPSLGLTCTGTHGCI